MKNAYQDHIKKQLASESSCSKVIEELPNKKIGRLLMTGEEIDVQVQRYLLDLKGRGCVINTRIAIAVGEVPTESISTVVCIPGLFTT